MQLNVNGHPEKLVKDLREVADKIAANGNTESLYCVDEQGGDVAINFVPDSSEFGLEDTLYVETDDE